MKLLLVKPHFDGGTYLFGPPLGLMALAAYVRKNAGHDVDVRIHDARVDDGSLHEVLKNFKPDVVGISAMSFEHEVMSRSARRVKEFCPAAMVIAGGPHATAFPEEVLGDENIDVAVRGEGEETLVELLDRLHRGQKLDGTPGAMIRMPDGIFESGPARWPVDCEALPIPAWDLVDIEKHIGVMSFSIFNKGSRPAPIFTSRGCPYKCVFCHNVFGKRFRAKSAGGVLEEIRYLVETYGVDEIMVFEDIFNWDKKRLKEICRRLIASDMDVFLSFPNGVRGDLLDEETILLLKRAGAYALTVAVETASPRLQKKIRKNVNLDNIRRVIDIAYEQDLIMKAFFMIGFPTETREEIEQTLAFALNPKLTIAGLLIVNVQKNTELYDMVKAEYPDYEQSFDCYDYYTENPDYENVVAHPLRDIQRRFYLRFYLNPRRMLRIAKLVPNLRGLARGGDYFLVIVFRSLYQRVGGLLSSIEKEGQSAFWARGKTNGWEGS